MIAVGIAQYLDGLGLVTFDEAGVSGDAFINVMPASPDTVVTLTDYGGVAPDVRLGYDSPNLQVRTRATRDPRPAHARQMAIYDALHRLHDVTLPNGVYVVGCWAIQSGPTPLGADANGRHEYVLNYRLHVRNETAHRE